MLPARPAAPDRPSDGRCPGFNGSDSGLCRYNQGMASPEGMEATLTRALEGDPKSIRALVDALTPVVQARVARALLSCRPRSRDVRQEVEDLTQDVFELLFADGAKALRRWDPSRRASLVSYVSLIAQRQVVTALRSGRKTPWREEATEGALLARHEETSPGPSEQVASRHELRTVLDELHARLSPTGARMLRSLVLEQRDIREVAAETQLSPNALYAWRHRLLKLAHEVRAQLADGEACPSTKVPR